MTRSRSVDEGRCEEGLNEMEGESRCASDLAPRALPQLWEVKTSTMYYSGQL